MTQPPFWQPALGRPQLWRTLLGGLILVGVIFALVTFALLFVAIKIFDLTRFQLAQAATPGTAMMIFLPFLGGFHIGLALMLPLLHKRGYLSLFGPPSLRLNLRHFTYGMGGAIAVMAVAASPSPGWSNCSGPARPGSSWSAPPC